MSNSRKWGRRALVTALLIAGGLLTAASTASAGHCPPRGYRNYRPQVYGGYGGYGNYGYRQGYQSYGRSYGYQYGYSNYGRSHSFYGGYSQPGYGYNYYYSR